MARLLSFLKYFIPFSIILFLAQHFVTISVLKNTTFFYPTWSIYTFHVLATFLIYIFILFVHKSFPDKTGFAFMSASVLKMMAVVVFLIPLIQSDRTNTIPDIAAFFIPYFLYLFFETFFALQLLNKQ